MFFLTDQPIDGAARQRELVDPGAGACVVFEGWVRNHHGGRPVTLLEYEAYDVLARLEGEAIVAEAEQAHPGCRILCVHRTGALQVGEAAVWIGAVSPHRPTAFLACRQVIEELKRRLPVWKKEHHPDGAAEWVNCTVEATAGPLGPANFYARQAALPEVGAAGQAALAAASVLVVGVGGLGCPAALYLATAGVGRLALVDGGRIEVSNLHRQILFTADDVGAVKVAVAGARLRTHNPLIQIETRATDLTLANVRPHVAGRTVVLDCTDNFAARFLLHDACRAAGVTLVQGAVHGFEGELNVFHAQAGGCLHCLWSGRGPDDLDAGGGCAGGPIFGPTVGLLGVMQAAEALKAILRLGSATEPPRTRLLNLLDGSSQAIERVADPFCPVCGRPDPAPAVRGAVESGASVVLSREELAALSPAQTVAVLEPGEWLGTGNASGAVTPVLAGDMIRLRELAARGPTVLVCRSGVRSAALARLLRAQGLGQVYALAGPMPAIQPAPARGPGSTP